MWSRKEVAEENVDEKGIVKEKKWIRKVVKEKSVYKSGDRREKGQGR